MCFSMRVMDRYVEQLISDSHLTPASIEYNGGNDSLDMCTQSSGIEETGWKRRHTRHWSNGDFLDFIYALANEFGDIVNINDLAGERFQKLSGGDLYRMTREDFIRRDPVHGAFIYQHLQQRMSQDNSTPEPIANSELSSSVASWSAVSHLNFTSALNEANSFKPYTSSCDNFNRSRPHLLPLAVEQYSEDSDQDLTNSCENTVEKASKSDAQIDDKLSDFIKGESSWCPRSSAGYANSATSDLRLGQPTVYHHQDWIPQLFNGGSNDVSVSIDRYSPQTTNMIYRSAQPASVSCIDLSPVTFGNVLSQSEQLSHGQTSPSTEPLEAKNKTSACRVKRSYTRRQTTAKSKTEISDIKSDGRSCNMELSESSRKTQSGGKSSLHLWEFIRDLLRATDVNACITTHHLPSLPSGLRAEQIIRWEDQSAGVFRILDSRAVAMLWGEQKNHRKNKMTYEKLSRALRWCRTYGFLSSVPKDGRFPKKLCFCFGPKATNWQI